MKKGAMFRIERYGRTRFWALYEAKELLCVTVYKKGAAAVKERLERVEPTDTVPPLQPTPAGDRRRVD